MSKVTIQGDANGTGIFTIASPNSNTDRTLVLPDEAGTMALQGGAGVGKVLQVVQTVKSDKSSTTSMSPVDVPGLSVTVTPISASSKILVITTINYGGGTNMYGAFYVQRGTSNVVVGSYPTGLQTAATIGVGVPTDAYKLGTAAHTFLDSPNTTAAITYKVQVQSRWQSLPIVINAPYGEDNGTYVVGGTSSITVMEIAA